MKVLCHFLSGFGLAMAMNDATNVVNWIALFSLSLIGTIGFNCLEKPQ